jgi:putative ABC transport system ATP-binding protein
MSLVATPLHYRYASGPEIFSPAISLSPGEHLLVLGPSGCGKTTLLCMLAGLLQPTRGQVHINQQDLYNMGAAARDRFRGRHIGMVTQKHLFVPALTVLDNLLLANRLTGLPVQNNKALHLLEEFGLLHKSHEHTQHLSQGEQQRVAIIRALMNDPYVLICDEPTSALDDIQTRKVAEWLLHAQTGAALVVVTHDNRLRQVFPQVIHMTNQESTGG